MVIVTLVERGSGPRESGDALHLKLALLYMWTEGRAPNGIEPRRPVASEKRILLGVRNSFEARRAIYGNTSSFWGSPPW